MRHKIKEEDKKVDLSVTINSDLFELLNNESQKTKVNKSKLIENILRKYLKNKGIDTDNMIQDTKKTFFDF